MKRLPPHAPAKPRVVTLTPISAEEAARLKAEDAAPLITIAPGAALVGPLLGIVVGGLIGAGRGKTEKDRARNAKMGAAIGALIGGVGEAFITTPKVLAPKADK